jgi:hypothetical protein
MPCRWFRHLTFAICLPHKAGRIACIVAILPFAMSLASADQVIMKDGTVYKGKIEIDTDKAVLIGNPPFDPTSYLLKAEDIAKIIYEEYHPNPPAERKRGFLFEGRVNGNVLSSNQISFGPATSLYGGVGIRVHPLVELDGGLEWTPSLHDGNTFGVTNPMATRYYEDFWQYQEVFSARLYPFYEKKWTTEPYLTAGYSWSHQIPKASGDSLSGSGWQVGFGAIRPLTTHIFLEGRFVYQRMSYDTIQFLGQNETFEPAITQNVYSFSVGASYRL